MKKFYSLFFTTFFINFSINAAPAENPYRLLNIQSSLPRSYQERLENYLKVAPQKDGPNSFQVTAFITGLTNRMTYMSDQEFVWLLKKFNCQKIEDHTALKSGDIGLLSNNITHNGTKNYEHAFIWDRYPELVVEKIGSYSTFKVKQSHIRESEQWTMFKKECLTSPDMCPLKLTNYRCPQYLAEKVPMGSHPLNQLTRAIEEWMFNSHSLSKIDLSELTQELQAIIKNNSHEITKQKNTNLFESYSLEKEEALSLLRQIEIFKDQNSIR